MLRMGYKLRENFLISRACARVLLLSLSLSLCKNRAKLTEIWHFGKKFSQTQLIKGYRKICYLRKTLHF